MRCLRAYVDGVEHGQYAVPSDWRAQGLFDNPVIESGLSGLEEALVRADARAVRNFEHWVNEPQDAEKAAAILRKSFPHVRKLQEVAEWLVEMASSHAEFALEI